MPSIETPAAPEATHTPSHDLKASKASAQPFVEVSAPFQHILSTAAFPHLPQNSTFPGVYSPPSKPDDVAGAVKLVEQWAASGELKETLKAHGGALVLRGLPLPTADAFSKVAFATKVGTVPHVEVGRPPKRTVLAPAVSTANEGAKENPTEVGGETPIISGIEVAAELEKRAPVFYRNLEAKGVLYSYRYTVDEAVGSNSGASVLSAYGQEVLPSDSPEVSRQKVEKEVRKHSDRFDWNEDGSITVYHRVPIIRTHHVTVRRVFFGNLISAYARAKHHHALLPPFLGDDGGYHPLPLYGDGSTIDVADLETLNQIIESTKAVVKWDQGDVLILDNHAALHSRVPWEGERKILASLWDGEKFADEQNPWGEMQWEAFKKEGTAI